MASDWEEIELGQIASIIGGGTPSSKIDDYWEGNIPWITPKDLSNHPYKLISRGSRNITQLGLESSSAKLMPAGTLLISSRAPIGYTAIAKNELCTSQGFKSLILKDGYSSDFFYYLIKGNVSKLEAVSSGSTFKEISGSTLKKISFIVPPLKEQKLIAHILGSLDKKIELNRQMNETLEAVAQALFKSWFVDFDLVIDNALAAGNALPDELLDRAEKRKGVNRKDNPDIQNLFPNEFELTEKMGWIPKGWGNGALADICFFGKDKINTSELSLENYVSTENMNKEKSGISHAMSIASTDQVPKFSVGQTLISNIRPYFKKIWLASFSGGRSNDVLGFKANNSVASEYLFNLLYQDSFFDYMTATSKGTKMPRGDKAAIMSWSVAIPSTILMEEFSRKVKPMYLANQARSAQATSLTELRETLLPKLMSGELRIPDAAVILEEF